MGGGPGWALRVRQADPDPDPLPDPQVPSLGQDGPILGPMGDTMGVLLVTYVFSGKITNQRPH